MTCLGNFPSSGRENYPYLKPVQEVDPDKPVCTWSCWGDETDPTFLYTFFWICFPDPDFYHLRVVESVIVLAPVEHPY